ncbi:MAG: hypothetical protein LWX11_07285 [Firmicutes bacterium]|nr:hypothetical protein [Bacillota bacterium]
MPWLVQHWPVRPAELDALRETSLQRFMDAEPLDATNSRFGFDEGQAWFAQELPGTPLEELWPRWTERCRSAFLEYLEKTLGLSPQPRALWPQAIHLRPGGLVVPRVLGTAPVSLDQFRREMSKLSPPGTEDGPRPWEAPPERLVASRRPIRGRARELTYLKSLMMGINAPLHPERLFVLMGEEGLGQKTLADWAMAATEAEGLWAASFDVKPGEGAGAFLARSLETLIQGSEADVYARCPRASRILARRVASFALLGGGARTVPAEKPLSEEEIQSALEILIQGLKPRVFFVQRVDWGDESLHRLLIRLATESDLTWFFTVEQPALRSFLDPLKGHPAVVFMTLNALEEVDLDQIVDDLLEGPRVPELLRQHLLKASLGNPSLLEDLLDQARREGALTWSGKGWIPTRPSVERPATLEKKIVRLLAGRLQRLSASELAVARVLALVGLPLGTRALGQALGIGGDPLDHALQGVVEAGLARQEGGRVTLVDPSLRELTMAGCSTPESRRLARSALNALLEMGRIHMARGRLQQGLTSFRSAVGLVAGERDSKERLEARLELARAHFVMGYPDAAQEALSEALREAEALGHRASLAQLHLNVGLFRSIEQSLGESLRHLELASSAFKALGDEAGQSMARAWKARTLGLLGRETEADFEMERALTFPATGLGDLDRGERWLLKSERSAQRHQFDQAARECLESAASFKGSGHVWYERFARLRALQAKTAGLGEAPFAMEEAWMELEALKAFSEGTGSRWLEMEWRRAHALLLSVAPHPTEAMAAEALVAWSDVQTVAQQWKFLGLVLEASARSSMLLMAQGEKLGARARLQDAFGAFQTLWSGVPEAYGDTFLERPDMRRFRAAVEGAGLRFVLPERLPALPEWTPVPRKTAP